MISSDDLNHSRKGLVAAMADNLGLSETPGNVLVKTVESGSPRD